MADILDLTLTANASQYTNELKRVVEELVKLNRAEISVVEVVEKAGRGLDLAADGAANFTVKLKSVNQAGRTIIDTYTAVNDKLQHTKRELTNIKALSSQDTTGRRGSWIEAAIERKPVPQGFDIKNVAPKDMINYNAEMTRLKELVAAYSGSYKQVKDVWSNLELGNPQKITGDLAKIQAAMQRVINVREKILSPETAAANAAKKEADALAASLERIERKQVKKQLAQELREVADAARQAKIKMDALHESALKQYAGSILRPKLDTLQPGKGAAPDSILALGDAKNKLAEFLAKNIELRSKVDQVWNDVAKGSIKQYEGELQKLQALLLRLRQAHGETGNAAGHGNDAALKASMELNGQLEAQRRKLTDLSFSWQTMFRLVVSQGASRVISQMNQELSQAITLSLELSKQVAAVTTVDKTGMSTESWASSLRAINEESGMGMLDTTKAAYQALSNQVGEGARNLTFLKEANDLAILGLSTSTQSVDLLSSAINSWGYDVSETREIAAKFFKTVELGRVTIPDMASSLGRLAPQAAMLGISLDELGASIAAITMKGVKYEVASTFMRNVMMKLAKPTQDLSEWFSELGYASGEAMIAAEGFGGFLEKLEEKAKGSSTEIAALFRDIRATSGATMFAGQGLRVYQQDLEAIGKASETYDAQVQKLKDTIGHQWDVAGEKIKDVFALDMTSPFLERLSKATNEFQLFVDIVEAAKTPVTALAAGALVPLALGALKAANALRVLSLSFFSLHPAVFTVTALATVIGAVTAATEDLETKNKKVFEDWVSGYNKVADEAQAQATREQRIAERSYDEQVKPYRKMLAEKQAALNKAMKEQEGLEKKLKDTILDSQQAEKAAIDKTVQAIQAKVSEVKSSIKQIKDEANKAFQDIAKMKLDQSMLGKSSAEKTPLLDAEISKIKAQQKEAYEAGDITKFKDFSAQLDAAYKDRNSLIESAVNETGSVLDTYQDAINAKQKEIQDALAKVDESSRRTRAVGVGKGRQARSAAFESSEKQAEVRQLQDELLQLQQEAQQAAKAVNQYQVDKQAVVFSISGGSDVLQKLRIDAEQEQARRDRLSSNEALASAQESMIAAKEEEKAMLESMQKTQEEVLKQQENELDVQKTMLEDLEQAYTGLKSIRDSELNTEKEITENLKLQLGYLDKIQALRPDADLTQIRQPIQQLLQTDLSVKEQKAKTDAFETEDRAAKEALKTAAADLKQASADLDTQKTDIATIASKIRVAAPVRPEGFNLVDFANYRSQLRDYMRGEAIPETAKESYSNTQVELERAYLALSKLSSDAVLSAEQVAKLQEPLRALKPTGEGDTALQKRIFQLSIQKPEDFLAEQRYYQDAMSAKKLAEQSLAATGAKYSVPDRQAIQPAQTVNNNPVNNNTITVNIPVQEMQGLDYEQVAKKSAKYIATELDRMNASGRR